MSGDCRRCCLWRGTVANALLAHLHAIPDVLQDYLHLRNTSQHDAQMADTVESPDTERDKRPISRASFSSASLTPITESPSVRSLSLPNPRLFHDDSTNAADEDDEEETEEQETSFESQLPAPVPLTSTQLIARVAALAADAVRGSLEKVNLSNAAYTLVCVSSVNIQACSSYVAIMIYRSTDMCEPLISP